MGQEIEVRPGIVTKDSEGRAACIPIYSRIVSLKAESNDLQYAVPGGLIGVGTTVRLKTPQPVTVLQNVMSVARVSVTPSVTSVTPDRVAVLVFVYLSCGLLHGAFLFGVALHDTVVAGAAIASISAVIK